MREEIGKIHKINIVILIKVKSIMSRGGGRLTNHVFVRPDIITCFLGTRMSIIVIDNFCQGESYINGR